MWVIMLVKEGLAMKVNAMEVFWRAHVNKMPICQLISVHAESFKTVYNSIDC